LSLEVEVEVDSSLLAAAVLVVIFIQLHNLFPEVSLCKLVVVVKVEKL
jgi:hypothetical protein